jgi:hypothetical protein
MAGTRRLGPLDQNALSEIVEGTATETGEAFFDELVKHLARAIGTKCAWVTEWLESERRLRSFSFWVGDRFFGDFEYDIADTPCEPVIANRRLIHVPERLLELYSSDASLEPLGAVSYMGVPLFDTDDRILGHLAVLHDAPMPEDERVTAIFNIGRHRRARRRPVHREHEQRGGEDLRLRRGGIARIDVRRFPLPRVARQTNLPHRRSEATAGGETVALDSRRP